MTASWYSDPTASHSIFSLQPSFVCASFNRSCFSFLFWYMLLAWHLIQPHTNYTHTKGAMYKNTDWIQTFNQTQQDGLVRAAGPKERRKTNWWDTESMLTCHLLYVCLFGINGGRRVEKTKWGMMTVSQGHSSFLSGRVAVWGEMVLEGMKGVGVSEGSGGKWWQKGML